MGHWDDARDLQVGEWGTNRGKFFSWELTPVISFLLLPHTHNFLASCQWPTGGTKRASFFPMLLHVCDTTVSPLAQLWRASLQPLACFLTFSSPDCHPFPYWSGQDFTLSNWSLYFQLSFCMLLTHHPDDGGSIHLWNVGLLLWNYMSLQPRKLSSTYSTVETWNLTLLTLFLYAAYLFKFPCSQSTAGGLMVAHMVQSVLSVVELINSQ
jgi:hypothetical protein